MIGFTNIMLSEMGDKHTAWQQLGDNWFGILLFGGVITLASVMPKVSHRKVFLEESDLAPNLALQPSDVAPNLALLARFKVFRRACLGRESQLSPYRMWLSVQGSHILWSLQQTRVVQC